AMTRLKQIHRRAHSKVDEHGPRTTQLGPRFLWWRTYSLAWRMRQIVGTELKFLSQFGVDSLESASQFGFDAFTRGRFLQLRKIRDRGAECDPYRRAPHWKPTPFRIKTIASENDARNDRHLRDVGECRRTRAKSRALQERICAIADPAFRKHAHDTAVS